MATGPTLSHHRCWSACIARSATPLAREVLEEGRGGGGGLGPKSLRTKNGPIRFSLMQISVFPTMVPLVGVGGSREGYPPLLRWCTAIVILPFPWPHPLSLRHRTQITSRSYSYCTRVTWPATPASQSLHPCRWGAPVKGQPPSRGAAVATDQKERGVARELLEEGGGGTPAPQHSGPDSPPKAFPYPNTGPNRICNRQ